MRHDPDIRTVATVHRTVPLRASRPSIDPQSIARAAALIAVLIVELLLFTGINGMVDDLLVSFVATVASSLLFLPLMIGRPAR